MSFIKGMCYAVGGPPLHRDLHVSYFDTPFPDLLGMFIYTRNYDRHRKAEELDKLASQMHMTAIINRVEPRIAERMVQDMRNRAKKLRQPEMPERLVIDPAMMKFLMGSQALQEAQAELEEVGRTEYDVRLG